MSREEESSVGTATSGDTVRVHYTGKLDDDTVFDTSEGRDPIEFTVGAGEVIPGFEQAVLGMEPGEEKAVEIPADEAYGDRRDDLIVSLERSTLPDELDPEVGQELQMRDKSGNTFPVRITEIGEEQVTVDANHPLAGQPLNFDIELVEIV